VIFLIGLSMLMFQIFAALLPCLGNVLGAKDSFHLSYLHKPNAQRNRLLPKRHLRRLKMPRRHHLVLQRRLGHEPHDGVPARHSRVQHIQWNDSFACLLRRDACPHQRHRNARRLPLRLPSPPRDLSELLALFSDADVSSLFGLYVYPAMVWANLKGADTLGQQNPAFIACAADTLQCLLAIMLYYCQPSLFARVLFPYAQNSTLSASSPGLRNFAYDLQALAPPDTEFALAELKYQIVVGRLTLVVYVGLCGFALLLCLMALSWGCCAPSASKVPQTTAFPAWDERVKCRIKYADEEAGAVLDEDVSEMVGRRLVKTGGRIAGRVGLKPCIRSH
jgi:hypothetical protein